MTENEKIAQIKWLIEKHPVISKDKDFIEPLTDAIQALEENQEFHAIGTIEEFKALKEKNEPKKPLILDRRYENGEEVCIEWKCPVCGLNVIEEPPCQEYCQRCGNKLDWE